MADIQALNQQLTDNPKRSYEPWANTPGGYGAWTDPAAVAKRAGALARYQQPKVAPLSPTTPTGMTSSVSPQPQQISSTGLPARQYAPVNDGMNRNLAQGENQIHSILNSPAGIALQNNPAYINGTFEERQRMWGELVANFGREGQISPLMANQVNKQSNSPGVNLAQSGALQPQMQSQGGYFQTLMNLVRQLGGAR